MVNDKSFIDNNSKSLYNEGMLQIQRLNSSWMKCNYYSANGLFEKWNYELDVIWRELCFDIFKRGKVKDIGEFEASEDVKSYNKLNKDLSLALRLKNRYAIYVLLSKKETFLRILQHLAGKGGKYEDDSDMHIED